MLFTILGILLSFLLALALVGVLLIILVVTYCVGRILLAFRGITWGGDDESDV